NFFITLVLFLGHGVIPSHEVPERRSPIGSMLRGAGRLRRYVSSEATGRANVPRQSVAVKWGY
ncbi:hypothetical protein LCGC14_2097450, partial [marine sediment metagenome]